MNKAPDAFRTISEVAEELELPQHVLRFWETRFAQIRPMKAAAAGAITGPMTSICCAASAIFSMARATRSAACSASSRIMAQVRAVRLAGGRAAAPAGSRRPRRRRRRRGVRGARPRIAEPAVFAAGAGEGRAWCAVAARAGDDHGADEEARPPPRTRADAARAALGPSSVEGAEAGAAGSGSPTRRSPSCRRPLASSPSAAA